METHASYLTQLGGPEAALSLVPAQHLPLEPTNKGAKAQIDEADNVRKLKVEEWSQELLQKLYLLRTNHRGASAQHVRLAIRKAVLLRQSSVDAVDKRVVEALPQDIVNGAAILQHGGSTKHCQVDRAQERSERVSLSNYSNVKRSSPSDQGLSKQDDDEYPAAISHPRGENGFKAFHQVHGMQYPPLPENATETAKLFERIVYSGDGGHTVFIPYDGTAAAPKVEKAVAVQRRAPAPSAPLRKTIVKPTVRGEYPSGISKTQLEKHVCLTTQKQPLQRPTKWFDATCLLLKIRGGPELRGFDLLRRAQFYERVHSQLDKFLEIIFSSQEIGTDGPPLPAHPATKSDDAFGKGLKTRKKVTFQDQLRPPPRHLSVVSPQGISERERLMRAYKKYWHSTERKKLVKRFRRLEKGVSTRGEVTVDSTRRNIFELCDEQPKAKASGPVAQSLSPNEPSPLVRRNRTLNMGLWSHHQRSQKRKAETMAGPASTKKIKLDFDLDLEGYPGLGHIEPPSLPRSHDLMACMSLLEGRKEGTEFKIDGRQIYDLMSLGPRKTGNLLQDGHRLELRAKQDQLRIAAHRAKRGSHWSRSETKVGAVNKALSLHFLPRCVTTLIAEHAKITLGDRDGAGEGTRVKVHAKKYGAVFVKVLNDFEYAVDGLTWGVGMML